MNKMYLLLGSGFMTKWFSYLLVITGVLLFSLGAYEYLKTFELQSESLAEAYQAVNKSPQQLESGKDFSFEPNQGESVGILSIPKIESELPIIEGTNEEELEKGVGHFKNSGYPLENKQIVLSGHRDTVFRKMGEIEIGDLFILRLPYGEFTYKIVDTNIVDADDPSIIKPDFDEEILTVTTCYPFSYIGNAPHRYILTAKPL
jgi:sortase A